jgi:hypothetical protein
LVQRIADPVRAADAKLNEGAPLPPPATPEQLANAEALLGFELPPLLRRLYLEVANGWIGPGYGLIELPRGEPGPADLVGNYWYVRGDQRQPDPSKHLDPSLVVELPASEGADSEWDDADDAENVPVPVWDWPAHLLPIFMHGCGAQECIDWTKPHGPMVLHDPDYFPPGGTVADTLAELAPSLESRLEDWLAGRDRYQEAKDKLAQRGKSE